MQIIALRHSRDTYFFAVAVNQMQSITDRLKINSNIDRWNAENQTVLPNGKGIIDGSSITIYWGQWAHYTCPHTQLGQSGCLRQTLQ